MTIVSNSGPIISFVRAEQLVLLQRTVGELTIPAAVYEEIVVLGAGKLGAESIGGAPWIKQRTITNRAVIIELSSKLHHGEREAIGLAKELDAILLVDDREARAEALRLGIKHFGSLSVLKHAKHLSVIQMVKPVLDELISSGTYISEALYSEFLALVEE